MAPQHRYALQNFLLMANRMDAHLHEIRPAQLEYVVNRGDAVVQEQADVAFELQRGQPRSNTVPSMDGAHGRRSSEKWSVKENKEQCISEWQRDGTKKIEEQD